MDRVRQHAMEEVAVRLLRNEGASRLDSTDAEAAEVAERIVGHFGLA